MNFRKQAEKIVTDIYKTDRTQEAVEELTYRLQAVYAMGWEQCAKKLHQSKVESKL